MVFSHRVFRRPKSCKNLIFVLYDFDYFVMTHNRIILTYITNMELLLCCSLLLYTSQAASHSQIVANITHILHPPASPLSKSLTLQYYFRFSCFTDLFCSSTRDGCMSAMQDAGRAFHTEKKSSTYIMWLMFE
jgi:hypothetical protein